MAKRLKRDKFFGLNTADPVKCGSLREFHEAQAIRNVRLNVTQGMTVRPGRLLVGDIQTYGVSGDIDMPRVVYNASTGRWDAYCAAVEGAYDWEVGNYHNDHATYPDKKYCNFCESLSDVVAVGTQTAAVVAAREPIDLYTGASDMGFDGTEDIHCIYFRYKPVGGSYGYYTCYVTESNFGTLLNEIYSLVGNKQFIFAWSVFKANGAAADYTFNESALADAGIRLWGQDGAGGERVNDEVINNDIAHSIDYFKDSYGYNHVLVSAGKYIYDDTTLVIGTPPTVSMGGLTADKRADGCSHQGFYWYCNGTDENKKFNGIEWSRMGLPAPAAPTVTSTGIPGGVLTGEYQYAYLYAKRHEAQGYETTSALSDVTIYIASAETLKIAIKADPTGMADVARLYRRSSDRIDWRQVPWKFVGPTPVWDIDISAGDEEVDDGNEEDDLLDTPLEYATEGEPLDIDLAPVAFDGVVAWKSRLWGWKDKYLYHTAPGRPEKWFSDKSDYQPWLIDTKNEQNITGCASVGEYLLVFTPDEAYYIPGEDRDEDSFNVLVLEGAFGCIAPRSIVDCSGTLMWLSKEGVYSFTPGVGVQHMSRQIDRDFNGRGIALLDAPVSTLQYASGLWLEDEKLYLLSVPRHGSAQNIQTFVYNFGMPAMQDMSRWSLYDFGFKGACRSNDKRVYSITGYDGKYHRENYGTRDNGNRILSYYKTRMYDFDQTLFDKRLLELTANGTGRGYPMKITTIVDVPDYGYVEDSDTLKEDGGGEGAGYIDPADDWEGSDPTDTPVVLDGEAPRLRHMSNYPQEMCGLFAGFKIDIAYEQDFDADVLWEKADPNDYDYTQKEALADWPVEDTLLKIDWGIDWPFCGLYPRNTAGGKYKKVIHDNVGKRTFVLHHAVLDSTTDAIITIIDHKYPAGVPNHIRKINATASGWPTDIPGDPYVANDMAYNPTTGQLAIAVNGYDSSPTFTAPGLIIIDAATRAVVDTYRPSKTISNCATACKTAYVRYNSGQWWTWTESTYASGTAGYRLLGYFASESNTEITARKALGGINEYVLCAHIGDAPHGNNAQGVAYDLSISREGGKRWRAYWITTNAPTNGAPTLGLPLHYVTSFDVDDNYIVIADSPAGSGAYAAQDHYKYGFQSSIYRIDKVELIKTKLDTPVFAADAVDFVATPKITHDKMFYSAGGECNMIGFMYGTDQTGLVESATLSLGSGGIGLVGITTTFKYNGPAIPGRNAEGFAYAQSSFGASYQNALTSSFENGEIDTEREFALSCGGCLTVLVTCYSDSTGPTGHSVHVEVSARNVIAGLVEVINVNSTPPLAADDYSAWPETEAYIIPYTAHGTAPPVTIQVAKQVNTGASSEYAAIRRGVYYSDVNGCYVFPASKKSAFVGGGVGLWRYTPAPPGETGTLDRLTPASSHIAYNFVGGIDRLDEEDGFFTIISSDTGQDLAVIQLYNAGDNTFNEQSITMDLGYSSVNAIAAAWDAKNSIFVGATGGSTTLVDGEIWIWRTQAPRDMFEDGSTYYDIFIDEADLYGDGSGPLIGNAFHGFEIAYDFDKRPHF